jgi:NAD(P)-dependent dehydrogenase (short-subunit alcohol dehydrogenase family)
MKIILVTGGNRGIGFEICRQLDKLGHTVILGSRNLAKGLAAAALLSKNVVVKQLDVTSEESIQSLYESVKKDFGEIDVLINNAGIGSDALEKKNIPTSGIKNVLKTNLPGAWKVAKLAIPVLRKAGIIAQKEGAKDVSILSVKQIMDTNFYAPWRMIQVFLPLLQKSKEGRIINVSSGMGELQSLTGDSPAYSLSKSSLNALTIMFSNELKGKGISVNAMCPGWVKTDMGGPDAPRNVGQGADRAVWLATEKEIPTGRFFRDRKEIEW